MNKVLLVLALIIFGCSVPPTLAQFVPPMHAQNAIQRAASGVQTLRSMMKDPDSFILESVFLTKEKNGYLRVCYFFRSRNSFGGYTGTEEAALGGKGVVIMDWSGSGFAFADPCRPKNLASDITKDVQSILENGGAKVE
jgi:hypothetical protein